MKEAVKSAVEIVNEKLEELILEDKNRCLFSNVKKSVLKENIVFPEVFSGKSGEDVYKFKEKLLQAVFDSQVREKDKVDVLRSYLSGDAKTLIGTHFTDIKEALNTLVSYFGHPSRIWKNKFSRIMTKIGGDPRTC